MAQVAACARCGGSGVDPELKVRDTDVAAVCSWCKGTGRAGIISTLLREPT